MNNAWLRRAICLTAICNAGLVIGAEGIVIPSAFIDDRVYVKMPAPDGRMPIQLFTDTGGGSLILSQRTALRLQLLLLPETDEAAIAEVGAGAQTSNANRFIEQHWPAVPPNANFKIVPELVLLPGWPASGDGMLGHAWFAGHTWTWDFPKRKLILRPDGWIPPPSAAPLPIAFKTDSYGRRVSDYPRMLIKVDEEELPVLFDTGATTILTPAALNLMGDKGLGLRATSMIGHSVFAQWIIRHPNWRIVNDAQLKTHSRMIEVPTMAVAGKSIGPVWFTERSDSTFHEFMSSMMSDKVEGSVGGNVFRSLAVTIDYPKGRGWIQ